MPIEDDFTDALVDGQVALLDRRVVICRAAASESSEKQC